MARSSRREKALARAGLKMADIDVVELNEAFAVQALACARELSIDLESMNIDGGAIAIGHPLGATGARITGKAAQILRREDKRYALATQCIGGGQGISTVLEAALMAIQKAAVIGAGLMGGGIAAHIANAGHDVVLLDIVPDGARDRNALAEGAVARMLKTDPAPFMEKSDAKRITTGNIEDHLHLLSDADWIVEAVIETVDAKQAVYRKIDSVRKEGAIVSSNTSTIPSAVLLGGMPDAFARDFLITHFFNPPRYMRLLEVVAGPASRAEAVAEVCDFADRKLGKGVVPCNDTPGFIANRIGTYWLIAAVRAAIESGVTVEEADAVLGRPIGVPKTGIFGLIDLVGLDLMPLVGRSLRDALPESDPLPRGLRRTCVHQRDDRERLYRPQGQGRLLQVEARLREEGEGGARPRHRRVRACSAPQARERRAGGRLAPGAVRASGQDRRLRLAGDVGHARLHRRAGARDCRRCRSGRSRNAPRLRLEARGRSR